MMNYHTGQINRLGHREKNQDRVAIVESQGSVLMILADGLGGHKGGEIASQTAVEAFIKEFAKSECPISDPKKFLDDSVLRAQKAIVDIGNRQDPPIVPRTTCVGCLVQNGIAFWVHIGDSRLYVFRDNEVFFRTADHSVVEQLIKKGVIGEDERTAHPRRNQITRCLGGDEEPEPTLGEKTELEGGDTILMCSDGLWDPLADDMIINHLKADDLNEAIKEMSHQAESESYPRSDNISVAAFRMIDEKVAKKEKKPKSKSKEKKVGESSLEDAIAHMKNSINEFRNEQN